LKSLSKDQSANSPHLAKTTDFVRTLNRRFRCSICLGTSRTLSRKGGAAALREDARDIKSAIITGLITGRLLYQLLFSGFVPILLTQNSLSRTTCTR